MPLYVDALSYIDISSLSLEQKFRFYLFDKNHYQLLFVYERPIALLRRIKALFFKRREHSKHA